MRLEFQVCCRDMLIFHCNMLIYRIKVIEDNKANKKRFSER